ncbi:MAG: hypothetical protein GSR85_11015 [Desulfurococcales archaeon]|nr:hypothetical protein [Desulfurococcales archaeon]
MGGEERHEDKKEKEIMVKTATEDVEELRAVLSAVTDFLASIKGPIMDIIEALSGSLDGRKLGEEVGEFYQNLVNNGVPEDMAKEMTREFFRKRLESAPTLSNFLNMLTSAIGGGKGPTVVKGGEAKEIMERVMKELDKAAERASPEARPFIEAIKKSLKEKSESKE